MLNFGKKKHFKKIIGEMCKKANTRLEDINFNDNHWYHQKEWTEQQEESFKKWLINYLAENKDARNEVMAFPNSYNKNSLERFASWFLLDYGWKIKIEK